MITLDLTEDRKHLKLIDASLNSEKSAIYSYFKKKSKDADFNVLVDRGIWDGMDHFMSKDGRIPVGLWKEVYNFSKKTGTEVIINEIDSLLDLEIDRSEFDQFVSDLFEGVLTDKGEPLFPRDYQIEGAFKALKYRFACEELATSAGKTAIFYTYNSYLKHKGIINKDRKSLLIVPNISLVNQTESAFKQYSNGLVEWNIHKIGGKGNEFDLEKFKECDMLITTYQSLVNLIPKCLDKRLETAIKKKWKKGEDEKRDQEINRIKRKILESKLNDIAGKFETVNVDECLHPDTLINMADMSKKKIKDVNKGDLVMTINDTTFEQEIREVDYIYRNLSKDNPMYELELDNGETIKITGNHKVKLISGKYKRVDELTLNDEILSVFD